MSLFPRRKLGGALLLASALFFLAPAFAADVDSTLPSCDQEMTTCPCNGVKVDKDLLHAGDVLMIRLEDTPIVSFPLQIN